MMKPLTDKRSKNISVPAAGCAQDQCTSVTTSARPAGIVKLLIRDPSGRNLVYPSRSKMELDVKSPTRLLAFWPTCVSVPASALRCRTGEEAELEMFTLGVPLIPTFHGPPCAAFTVP